jgi:hypothetical protein
MKRILGVWLIVSMMLALGACSGSSQPSPVLTTGGNYTALGGAPKNDHPTASDFADLQAAENGTLGQPALVEFYADY